MKTITFDETKWKLVPIEPTKEMVEAALHASIQHVLDCIADPARSSEVGSEENCKKTHASRYQSMISAAPECESEADEVGWIEWDGGDCPAYGSIVEVKFRDGDGVCRGDASDWYWKRASAKCSSDIVAYRVCK